MAEIKLPNLGEGVDSATVIAVIVKKGDTINIDDPIIEIETDKAVVPVPATEAGVVDNVLVKDGDVIKTGSTILSVKGGDKASSTPTPAVQTPKVEVASKPTSTGGASIDFKLPELGDGIAGGTIIGVLVKPGDVVKADDPILELETDKAVIPVPAPADGTISSIKVKDGQTVKVGEHLFTMSSTSGSSSPAPSVEAPKPATTTSASVGGLVEFKLPDLGDGIAGGTIIGVLLKKGDSVKTDDPVLELETDKAVIPVPAPANGTIADIKVKDGQTVKVGELLFTMNATGGAVSSTPEPVKTVASTPAVPSTSPTPKPVNNTAIVAPSKDVAAGPATRKFARELGVDLGKVGGSARGGRITIEDVKIFVKNAMQSGGGSSAVASLPALPDFSSFGPIRKEKISKLRKIVSERMTAYWTIPHVHQFNDVDVTAIVEMQKKYGGDFKEKGSSLSLTQFIIKAMVETVKQYPTFNASFDHINDELIIKDYYNVGVAVDTPTGLIVPVLKNVDKMSIFDIGKSLKELATKTRDRKIAVSDLQGAGITLSNLGGVGGTSFTPIINYPEVAIIGASKSVIKPIFIDGQFQPRHIMNICLAYDHRVIDGADGARFIKTLSDYLENIEKSLLM